MLPKPSVLPKPSEKKSDIEKVIQHVYRQLMETSGVVPAEFKKKLASHLLLVGDYLHLISKEKLVSR